MIEAGVAITINDPLVDGPGNFKYNYQLTHPEMYLIVHFTLLGFTNL